MSNISDNIKKAYRDAILSSLVVTTRQGRTAANECAKALHKTIKDEGLDFSETCNELREYYAASAKRIISNK